MESRRLELGGDPSVEQLRELSGLKEESWLGPEMALRDRGKATHLRSGPDIRRVRLRTSVRGQRGDERCERASQAFPLVGGN